MVSNKSAEIEVRGGKCEHSLALGLNILNTSESWGRVSCEVHFLFFGPNLVLAVVLNYLWMIIFHLFSFLPRIYNSSEIRNIKASWVSTVIWRLYCSEEGSFSLQVVQDLSDVLYLQGWSVSGRKKRLSSPLFILNCGSKCVWTLFCVLFCVLLPNCLDIENWYLIVSKL